LAEFVGSSGGDGRFWLALTATASIEYVSDRKCYTAQYREQNLIGQISSYKPNGQCGEPDRAEDEDIFVSMNFEARIKRENSCRENDQRQEQVNPQAFKPCTKDWKEKQKKWRECTVNNADERSCEPDPIPKVDIFCVGLAH
jgi:hypothetical protein